VKKGQKMNFYDAFISYGRADSKAFAINLNEKLTAAGLNIWFAVTFLVLMLLPLSQKANAQTSDSQLKTQFTGKNKCLDIINDGENNKPTMADCGNFSGQFWSLEPTQTRGYYRLKTQFTGKNKCLDIINDDENNKPAMADCGNFSGQFWNFSNSKKPPI
jgi:hypothetical protein